MLRTELGGVQPGHQRGFGGEEKWLKSSYLTLVDLVKTSKFDVPKCMGRFGASFCLMHGGQDLYLPNS